MKKLFTLLVLCAFAASAMAGVNHVLKVVNPEVKADTYGTQLFYRLPEALTSGTTYTLTVKVKLENELAEGIGMWPYAPGAGTQYTGFNVQSFTANEWTDLTCTFTASGNHTMLQFPIGHVNGAMYLDDVVLKAAGSDVNLVNNGTFDTEISHLCYWNYGKDDEIAPDTWWSWGWALPTVTNEVLSDDGGEVAVKKALEITCTTAKTYSWDIQAFISLPTLVAGEKYYVKFQAKATESFNLGTEAIDDVQTAHLNQYSASAVYNYAESGDIKTDFTEFTVTLPGVTNVNDCTVEGHDATADDHKNVQYAASAILLNLGKLPLDATLTIKEVKVYDANFNFVADVELKTVGAYDKTLSVYYPGWQGAATYKLVALEDPTATNIAAVDTKSENGYYYNTLGQRVTTPVQGQIYIHNGRKVIFK